MGRRLLLIGCAWACMACGEPRSQTFAITLTDSPTLQCEGYADGLLADPEALDELAKELRKAHKEAYQADPPMPAGRVLRVNELETRTVAWFEPHDSNATQPAVPLPEDAETGELPAIDPELPEVIALDDPEVVYEGEPQDDYIEASFAQLFNTDEEDEDQGLRLCGPRPRALGTLTLTTTDGIAGRIRWTEIFYVPSELCRCEGRVECARDFAVEGLAVE